MPTKQFLITAVLVMASAGAIVVMGKGPEQKQEKQQAVQLRFDRPEAVTKEKVAPNVELVHEAPTNVAPVEPPVEEAAAVETVVAAPAKQVETYKFATEMTAAGIAPADHGYATEMLLDDQGWRVFKRDKPVWQMARQTLGDLTDQLRQANYYVAVTYDGSWLAAYDLYQSRGTF